MSRRRSMGPAAALALTVLSLTAFLGSGPGVARPAALKSAYAIHLQSAWPQLAGAGGCVNGGEETLDGILMLDGTGSYGGTFHRHTRLLFCGAHGPGAGRRAA